MTENTQPLPWEELARTEGPIPWPAIDTFADALVADPSLWIPLARRYDRVTLSRDNYRGYEDLYIPASFAKAVPRLSRESILQISPFLLEKLSEAGYDDEEIRLEILSATCGRLGPVILPHVMEFIDREEDTQGAWVFLWGLLRLAGQVDDKQVRSQVMQYCAGVLELAEHNEVPLSDADVIPDIIAHLNGREHLGLLKRLEKKSKGTVSYAEFKEAIRILQGQQEPYHFREMWEESVETWLPQHWEWVKKWYKEVPGTSVDDENEDIEKHRMAKLRRRFLRSEDCATSLGHCRGDAAFITDSLLYYLWDHQGIPLEEVDEPTLKELLLEIFPRKITAEKEEFEQVAPVVSSFLVWLEKQDILPRGTKLAQTVASWADQIISNGMNPKLWGMGKRFSMQAQADGVHIPIHCLFIGDIHYYNTRHLMHSQADRPNVFESDVYRAPIPILNIDSKPGRNQSCPCGSGKKYKKCCGALNQIQG